MTPWWLLQTKLRYIQFINLIYIYISVEIHECDKSISVSGVSQLLLLYALYAWFIGLFGDFSHSFISMLRT